MSTAAGLGPLFNAEFFKDEKFFSIGSRMETKSNNTKEELILVDEDDREIGIGEKLSVHQEGKLHRAFSIFIFDDSDRLLLQKRAKTKYHSGGLWSNTCCGHPRPGEKTLAAAHRRLREEMNFDCELGEIFAFHYQTGFENGLIENEYDHVFVGRFNGQPEPSKAEAEDWKWITLPDLKQDLLEKPSDYTFWLRIALEKNKWRSLDTFMVGLRASNLEVS